VGSTGGQRRAPTRVAEAVVDRARTGDQDAWRDLYTAYAGRVAGYLRVQGVADPEDLTSDVFLAVFRNLGSFVGDEARFRSWLFVIVHRRLIDERRRAGRRDEVPIDDAPEIATRVDTEDAAFGRIGTRRVEELCEQLVPDQRDVLLLRLVADLTVEQVAEVVGKSPGAVKAVQRRGLASLARISKREGVPL
jgi:RNA polymerase sigma-70 factor (ECF subfamily)